MTREEIIKYAREAIEFNKTVRDKNNNVLSHAIGLLEKRDGEYERGMNEVWDLIRKVCEMSVSTRKQVFGIDGMYVDELTYQLTPQEALAKLKAYEKKKEEEAAKPKLGNVVHIFGLNGTFITDGVLVGITFDKYYILRKSRGMVPEAWDIESYEFEKTGEYVDIQGMLDKIG